MSLFIGDTASRVRWASGLRARLSRYRETAATMRALHKLSDSALRDIGLHRSEIGGVATFNHLKDRR